MLHRPHAMLSAGGLMDWDITDNIQGHHSTGILSNDALRKRMRTMQGESGELVGASRQHRRKPVRTHVSKCPLAGRDSVGGGGEVQ
mgnify:CR=1 FL=1